MLKVKKAVIPAAGLGTRFLPITKALPKPMLPVFDKPTIEYIVEEAESAGIEEIIIVVSPNSDVIKEHFGENKALKERLKSDNKQELLDIELKTERPNIRFVVQKEANGLAGAILSAGEYINGEPFALLLGDELLVKKEGEKSCLERLVDVYNRTDKSVIATMTVFGDDVSKYGNIGISDEDGDEMTVNAVVEKPSLNEALSNYAIIGRYVLDGKIIERLKKLKPKNNEIYLTDVLDDLAKENKLLALSFDDDRYDVGDKAGYIKANVNIALKSEVSDEIKDFIIKLAQKL